MVLPEKSSEKNNPVKLIIHNRLLEMNHHSLVSCIIIFYNAEQFIDEAVASVLAQTYRDWELLLVDDGSTDSSTEIARRHALENPTSIRYLEHEGHQNRGMSATRNLGISQARGEYIGFLDADDVWLPHKLEQQVAIFQSYPEAAMVYGRTLIWHGWTGRDDDIKRDSFVDLGVPPDTLYSPPALFYLLLANQAQTPTTCNALMRRQFIVDHGGFEDEFRGMYEDQVFFAKINLNAPVYVASQCWARYRQHPDNANATVPLTTYYKIRYPFMLWLERYLIRHGFNNHPHIWRSVQQELWSCRHPYLTQMMRLLRWRYGDTPRSADTIPPMASRSPLVSVIMPFYNGEKFLTEAIASIIAQSYKCWELLLIDDGSTDGGTAIAKVHAEQFPESIRYFEHPHHRNLGKSTSRNLGIHHARGEYITFLDADDVFLPAKLACQTAILQAHDAIGMVYGRTLYWYDWEGKGKGRKHNHLGKLGRRAGQSFEPPQLATFYLSNPGCVPCICSLLARTDLMRKIGGYDESIQHLYEDQVLIFKMCLKTSVYIIAECGEKYRQHPDSSTTIAIREGAYHPSKLNPTRYTFLTWLRDYIEQEGIADKQLKTALERALWPYQHARFYRLIAPFHYSLKCLADKLSWTD